MPNGLPGGESVLKILQRRAVYGTDEASVLCRQRLRFMSAEPLPDLSEGCVSCSYIDTCTVECAVRRMRESAKRQ